MITETEYLNALNVVRNYKIQIENQVNEVECLISKKIDLSHYIPRIGLNNLSAYFNEVHETSFNESDLERIDLELIKKINFKKLKKYPNIGAKTITGLKEVLSYTVS